MTRTRVLRHNLDAEASVLGGIILRNDLLTELDTLETDDFYHHPHKVVFEAMRNLEAADKPIDVVTLENEVEKQGKLESLGGVAFFGALALRVPTADNVREYAGIVQKLSRVRRLTLAASELTERSYEADADPEELLSMAHAVLSKLDDGRRDESEPIGAFVKRRIKELEKMWEAKARGEQVWMGAPTGVRGLDKRIGGGYPFGDVAIIAGRPAMGKSSLAMAAVDATTHTGFGAHVFSAEGGWRMYTDRCISRGAGISVDKLRSGELTTDDARGVSHAMMRYALRPNWELEPTGGLTAAEIVRRVRKHKKRLKTRLVVVDYLNILKRASPKMSENEALEDIVNTFAQAAPNDDIAWLLLCQLNREVEKRPDKRPTMSDLRGSGALEQAARVIVCPYRGSYYYDEPKRHIDYECPPNALCSSDSSTCSHAPTPEQFAQMFQALIVKNNNGDTGRVFANWRAETTEVW